jgi:hypothetical protein
MPDNPEIDCYWAGSLDTRLEALSRLRQAKGGGLSLTLLEKEVVNCLEPSPLGTVCGQAFIPLSHGG